MRNEIQEDNLLCFEEEIQMKCRLQKNKRNYKKDSMKSLSISQFLTFGLTLLLQLSLINNRQYIKLKIWANLRKKKSKKRKSRSKDHDWLGTIFINLLVTKNLNRQRHHNHMRKKSQKEATFLSVNNTKKMIWCAKWINKNHHLKWCLWHKHKKTTEQLEIWMKTTQILRLPIIKKTPLFLAKIKF